MTTRLLILSIGLLIASGFIQTNAYASGAFVPGGSNRNSEAYNVGKAIVIGEIATSAACKSCHDTFSRGSLSKLSLNVSELLSQCDQHQPCYNESLTASQLEALNTYFGKRYRLR